MSEWLSIQAAAVRARCERSAVERCHVTFDEKAEFGSVMAILLVGVRRGRVIGWVCKPEVAGSIPARSMRAPGARAAVRLGRRALTCALRGGARRRRYDARLLAFGFVAVLESYNTVAPRAQTSAIPSRA
jgi:hypothetical protein